MSDSDEHIKKSIKESFDGVQKKAPVDLWATISQHAQLTEDEFQIQSSFNNQTKIAPSETWSHVKKQLIIDEVWDRIAAYEDRRKRKVFWWYAGSISLFLLLFSLTLFNVNSNKNRSEYATIDKSRGLSKTTDSLSRTAPTGSELDRKGSMTLKKNSGTISFATETAKRTIHMPAQLAAQVDKSVESQTMGATDISNSSGFEHISTDRIPLKRVDLFEFGVPTERLNSTVDAVFTPPFKRFEVGLIATIGNSWLFNNDVKNGLNSTSLIRNNFSTGYSIGAVFVYNFNRKAGLELEYDAYSVHNQGYTVYDQGRLVHKEIQLKQQKMSLSYKFRLIQKADANRNFVMNTGCFFSHSIKDQTSIDGMNSTPKTSLDKFDYGLNLGAGVEHNFSKFKVEYGMKTNIGLHNMTANTLDFPKKFDYATTFILGGYASIRYFF